MPGEKLLWSGQPARGVLFTARDIFRVSFSLIWTGFAFFWEGSVVAQNAPLFFKLWGLPFVLIGLYLVAGRFLADAWIRTNTDYALTNRRVLINRNGPSKKVVSVVLDQIPDVSISESASGRGTIRFGPAGSVWPQRGFTSWMPSLDATPQFLGIENAREVFDQIQRLTSAATRESAHASP
jgi:hypothetical protein